VKAKH
jgi:hypothetical protein